MFHALFHWLRPPRQRPDLRVTMYTRAGCHLCEVAWAVLDASRTRHGFRLEAIDIDTSADLVAAHGTCIPVVVVNGRVRFRGRVNAVLWQRIIDAGPEPVE